MSLSLWANSPQSKLNTIKDNLAHNSGPITAHVVAWTLGTDLMRKRFINVSDIKVFVLDEADNMLDQDGLAMYEQNSGGGGEGGHFEKPDIETYIHRIGRTGRFGRRGTSIKFVHDKKTWLQMEQVEKATSRKIMGIETNDVDEMEEKMKEALK
ncbi:hypothetical protein B0H13DRAFT_2483268 [Mycena leptocephala]|nr:hypothetical protein B0H13DRAFT_2483268 [Mycena leptocephala]